jgi:predicted O-methyltransferase YrrM
MNIVSPEIERYLTERYRDRYGDPVLAEMEQRAAAEDFPIIGPLVGAECYRLARSIAARQVFELGSGVGYSTLWFARAVRDNGGGSVVHTIWEAELSRQARGYLERAGLGELVRYEVGEAVAALERDRGRYDIIFMDIDKHGYPGALPAIKQHLPVGGLLIVDNLLWHGRVLDQTDDDRATAGVRELTRQIFSDRDFVPTINPLRDGFLVASRLT